jgi:hypothetical protein
LKKVVLVFLVLAIPIISYPQDDLAGLLSKVQGPYASEYMQSFTDAFGANFNTGFNSNFGKTVLKLPFDINVKLGVVSSAVLLNESDKSFNLNYQAPVTVNGKEYQANYFAIGAPTVFGYKDNVLIKGYYYDENNEYHTAPDVTAISSLWDTKIVPFAMPQISIGTIYGTDLTVRYLPPIKIGDIGKFNLWGVTARHLVSRYFPEAKFDLYLSAGYQRLLFRDINDVDLIKGNGYMLNLQLMKNYSIASFYMAVQYELYGMSLDYTYNGDGGNVPIHTELHSRNYLKETIGAILNLKYFTLNAEVGIARRLMFSAGVGFGYFKNPESK